MLKKALLFLSALTIGVSAGAQNIKPCGTDEMHKKLKEQYPQIAIDEAIEAQIRAGLANGDISKYAKSTDADQLGNPTFIYDIPIVIHVIHQYGTNLNANNFNNVPDNQIYNAVKQWNEVFAKMNADTADVIAPFKKYIGNSRIRVHLAKRDPLGNPTTGITRHFSYLTTQGDNQAKIGGWPNTSYMNIWLINNMNADNLEAAAFALKPASGQQLPWYDGVISKASSFNQDNTIPHELAHTFNIDHVWGGTNNPEVACGDDNVDDTPPTKGHSPAGCNPTDLYDTTCSFGYLKVYPSSVIGIDSFVDYPDTNNSQNIMDYTYCAKMFTHGQVYRMHEALNSNTAGRNNLWSVGNLNATGVTEPAFDMPPMADMFVDPGIKADGNPILGTNPTYFLCAGTNAKFVFKNASWRDTVTSISWSLSNGATISSSTSQIVQTNFSQPGWVDVTLTANSNAGSNTLTKKLVYAADGANRIDPVSNGFYFQEFTPGGDLDKYPIFNYYDNNFKWQINNNTGYYDHSSMMYTGYDTRTQPHYNIGSPEGDVDDFFTPAFNLSTMANGECNLNYMFAGTALSAFYTDMKDLLTISYSTNCGESWIDIKTLKEDEIFNNGNVTIPYQPGWMGEWSLMSISVPPSARVDGVFFRFRYRPHVNAIGAVTSNNFYMDRLNISNFPTGANTLINEDRKIVVAPNPTTGSSSVIIKGDIGADANVMVTDITGKLVYKTSQKINSEYVTIEIPSESLGAKGMYMVQVITNNQSHTEKLVVY